MTKKKRCKSSAKNAIRNIRRNSRRQYSGEEKIRIVLEGLRGKETVAELCRREGISQSIYYRWNKIPQQVRDEVVALALEKPEKSPRELAWEFTDENEYYISESSVYRILKQFDPCRARSIR